MTITSPATETTAAATSIAITNAATTPAEMPLTIDDKEDSDPNAADYDNDNDTDSAIDAAEASSSSAAFHSGLNDTFVDVDTPSPTSSAPGSPSHMKFGNRRNDNNNKRDILSSAPDGSSSSSASPSAFHSPSNSITWASPSRTQQHHHKSSSPMTTVSQFVSLAEFNRNKGKGIARGFHRSYKEERRRLQQAQQIQPWKATMDGLPREIKIHIFRYLSTFQLVRVSRVSRSWRSIAMDGSLWKVIDTTRFYNIIKDDQLRVLGTAASGFLRYANFRGCVQLSGESLRAIAEHCPNVERLDLTGCRSVSSKSIADVCMNMPLLLHLELAGLQSVNNYTLQAMAVYCRSLQVLNLAWCKQISGFGLSNLTRSCQDLRKLNVSGCGGLEDRWMPVMGMNLPRLREICLNGCGSLTDRGLIGLLSGLSVASSRKHRKWRMRKRMATSVRVSSLGHLLVNQSSSCGDEDGGNEDEDEDDERDRVKRELEEEDEEYAMEDDSDRESEVDGDDEDDDGNQAKAISSSNGAAAATTSTTGSNGRSGEEGLQARLDYLGLSHCRLLTTESLRAIGHYCNRHLRRLELSGCESFGDEGLIILAQNCTRLRLLDLEDINLLTDASLRAFGLYLPKLERLSLSYCENVTDQGIIRMLRPAPNPTTLSTANNGVFANNADNAASLCCRRLVYLELDNCLLITDRLLLEFANVLEERKVLAIEKMKERERKREERRERIRQKKRKSSSLSFLRSASTSSANASSPVVSDDQQQQTRPTSFEGVNIYLGRNNNGEEGSTVMASGSGSGIGSGSFIASRPVNIPVRLRMNPSLAAEAAGPSNGGSFVSSYTSSPLQPRSVLASTSISDEMVVKKTRPGLRIMVPTRSSSTTSTTSTSTSSSLALWPSALQSRRRRLAAAAAAVSKNGKYIRPRPRRKLVRPTLQVFDCRNITLEGVEAAQLRCPSLAVKSYYSWTNPSTSVPAASTLGFGGSGGSLEEAFEGELEGDEEDDDEDADADDDENGSGVAGRRHGSRRSTSSVGGNAGLHGHGGGSSSGSANSSQTSLHHLHMQQQHLQLLQLQRLNRPANLLQRARLGLLGGHGGGHGHDGHRDSQCTIL
ncbi:hypothetical protein EC957_003514 [Mortierella hygrophila]|uniref:F-box domain-containing protein n=1 Tax=Mortierella hygrophila TaxID=979708 RepID=A0A9P6FFC2_9FUNG|nr:hypothetical protein EC957_003514 [Mortierella hygrophila]